MRGRVLLVVVLLLGLVQPVVGRPLTGRPAAASAAASEGVPRVAGPGRMETAVAVSTHLWETSTNAVVATAYNFPDALAAGPLAATLGAPILLTAKDAVPDFVLAELDRLGTTTVWVVGGPAAVSSAAEAQLAANGRTVHRLAGPDRFATAAAIATEVGPAATGEVLVALGQHADPARSSWADALAAGALAASPDRLPILLVGSGHVPGATVEALRTLGATKVLLIGGPGAVSEEVRSELERAGVTVRRLSGNSRYATSAAVTSEALRRRTGPVPVVYATGGAFPDGLAGAAAAARMGGVVLVIGSQDALQSPQANLLHDVFGDQLTSGIVVGGPGAVSEEAHQQLIAAIARGGLPTDPTQLLTMLWDGDLHTASLAVSQILALGGVATGTPNGVVNPAYEPAASWMVTPDEVAALAAEQRDTITAGRFTLDEWADTLYQLGVEFLDQPSVAMRDGLAAWASGGRTGVEEGTDDPTAWAGWWVYTLRRSQDPEFNADNPTATAPELVRLSDLEVSLLHAALDRILPGETTSGTARTASSRRASEGPDDMGCNMALAYWFGGNKIAGAGAAEVVKAGANKFSDRMLVRMVGSAATEAYKTAMERLDLVGKAAKVAMRYTSVTVSGTRLTDDRLHKPLAGTGERVFSRVRVAAGLTEQDYNDYVRVWGNAKVDQGKLNECMQLVGLPAIPTLGDLLGQMKEWRVEWGISHTTDGRQHTHISLDQNRFLNPGRLEMEMSPVNAYQTAATLVMDLKEEQTHTGVQKIEEVFVKGAVETDVPDPAGLVQSFLGATGTIADVLSGFIQNVWTADLYVRQGVEFHEDNCYQPASRSAMNSDVCADGRANGTITWTRTDAYSVQDLTVSVNLRFDWETWDQGGDWSFVDDGSVAFVDVSGQCAWSADNLTADNGLHVYLQWPGGQGYGNEPPVPDADEYWLSADASGGPCYGVSAACPTWSTVLRGDATGDGTSIVFDCAHESGSGDNWVRYEAIGTLDLSGTYPPMPHTNP